MRTIVLLFAFLAHSAASTSGDDCTCMIPKRPHVKETVKLARWIVHSLDWGVLSTTSSRLPGNIPFGNIYSFVDGPCGNSTGSIYFYGTQMDQSFQDMTVNPKASFALSEASLPTVCHGDSLKACSISHSNFGDPENPVCARLTISGTLVLVDEDTDEFAFAQNALFQRHPQMEYWPKGHGWQIAKLEIEDLWLINYFGGAKILSVHEYFATELELEDQD